MPVPPDIRDHAYRLFMQEVPDLLQTIETDLLSVMQERSLEKIHNLMRMAHSIKGGAASVDLQVIASLAHRLENIFKALYSDKLEIDTQLESQLLRAYDCLRLPLLQQVMTGEFDAEQALTVAEPAFVEIEAALGEILQQIDQYDIPTSAQLGVDMSLSILEIDVAEQLDRLAAAIATAEPDLVEAELRSQIEILIELAEILNKPGLAKISAAVLDAVNANSEQVLQIAPLALTNFQTYRETLLSSSGKQEVAPSAALLSWTESRSDHLHFNADIISPHYDQSLRSIENTVPWSDSDLDLDLFEDAFDLFVQSEELTGQSELEEQLFTETLNPNFQDTNYISEIVSHQNLEQIEILDAQFTTSPVVRSQPASDQSLSFQNTDLLSTTRPNQSATPMHGDMPSRSQMVTRVDSEQLEKMNNLVNEAVIKRSGLSLQNEQIQKTVRELLSRFAGVEQIATQLRKVSDCTLIPKSSQHLSIGSDHSALSNSDFDALELDRYGTLHTLLQQFLEDLIQLRESADDIALFARQSDKSLTTLRKSLNQLQDDFIWVRMLPIGEVLNRFPRMLHDLSIAYNKPVKLQLSGTEVLVDRAVIEQLYDPLLHLLRNAFDHGIEPPSVRRQRGKPEQGLIQIKAFHRGGETIIEVKDDGAGLNLKRIKQRSLALGILSPQDLTRLSDDRLSNLIFEPGFSTASQVNELSGRGIGLDVVRTQLRHLKGTIAVTSQPGAGVTFTLRLPLTLTSDNLLICLAGFTTLALPSDSIHEIFVPKADRVIHVGDQGFLQWRKEVFPIYRLADLLEYVGPTPESPPLDMLTKASTAPPSCSPEANLLVVVSWRQKFAALAIDQLLTEQKLVIKPFGAIIAPPNCLHGCTILGDGSIVPVVDAAALIDEALERSTRRKSLPAVSLPGHSITVEERNETVPQSSDRSGSDRPLHYQTRQIRSAAKILVVDDAVALRQTLALTLENAGYQVLQAGDGWGAIQQLQFDPGIALIISDIEMPNMNGFDFMNHRRQHSALMQIPLVILTSRSNDKHRRLALHLGATSYFTKPYIEKNLLQEIQQIIEQRIV